MANKISQVMLKPVVKALVHVENKLLNCQSKISKTKMNALGNLDDKFEPIMPSELNSIKQMKRFNKSTFGIKVFDVQDKEFAKFLTDGMISFYNKTEGIFGIPKNIIVCDLPNPDGFMMYESTKDILAISKKHLEKFREIATDNGETLEQVLNRWGQTKFDGTATSMYDKGLFKELFHDFGHKAHSTVCKNYGKLGIDWTKEEFQEIASKVSKYSKTSPEEFVAETFSLLVQGKILPEDVMKLYRECDGPIVKSPGGGSGGGYYNILTDFINQSGCTVVSLKDMNTYSKYVSEFPDITIEEAKCLERIDDSLAKTTRGISNSKIVIEA